MRALRFLHSPSVGNQVRALGLALVFAAGCHHDSVTGPNAAAGPACGDGSIVRLSANQAETVACGTNGKVITLSAGAKYLIVPQFATGSPGAGVADVPVAYQIGTPTTSSTIAVSASLAPQLASRAAPPLQQQFD